jgi:S-adenosylmethionine decarboxylase
MSVHAESLGRSAPTPSVRAFVAQVACWNLALFAVIRLAWFDQHVIGRLVEFQKALVFWYGAAPRPAIVVNSSCSGADVMALCAGVLLAYPSAWRRRLVGAAIGIGLILALNAVRIASLYAVASKPATLDLLHLHVWPAVLTLAAGLYVFAWIRASQRAACGVRHQWTRFALSAAGAFGIYAAAAPWVLTSTAMLQVGAWTATTAAAVLEGLGATVRTAGIVLATDRGAFQVTQECLFTPVIPLYLAAVLSLPLSRWWRAGWLAMAPPIFFALGVARLLTLALPAYVATSPIVLAHGFYQLVAGGVLVIGAAHLAAPRASGLRASLRTLVSLAVALLAGVVAARVWEPGLLVAARALQALVPATLTSLETAGDPQGAMALFPSYQVGLLAGLWLALTGGRRTGGFVAAAAGLAALQLALLAVAGTLGTGLATQPHALLVRAWALGVPLLLATAWLGPSGTRIGDHVYRRFWQDVGDEFPSLTGAASTTYYFDNERRLIEAALPSLDGCVLLKTDLWDEAKNTRILQWAADQGARVYGIDLSEPIVRAARDAFGRRPLTPIVSDVRRLPFGDASFDAIYSMGTIEHFAETEASVAELARILKPGGRLILGVPNRYDPFLRPALVALLNRLGLYGYGYEKSYSRRALRRMIEAAGLEVQMESGLLFLPGWLRMLDLWCHTRVRPLARVTGAFVQPFVWLDRRFPALRRHGYLLASVGVKPGDPMAQAALAEAAPLTATSGPSWRMPDVRSTADISLHTGTEYVIDARGCDPDALRSLPRLQRLFAEAHADLGLHHLAPPVWHVFPGAGGITGLVLLSESHLTIHTYPEIRLAAVNFYCCRPSADWGWKSRLRTLLGARQVTVRVLRRG